VALAFFVAALPHENLSLRLCRKKRQNKDDFYAALNKSGKAKKEQI
jgi:hypothetical protein